MPHAPLVRRRPFAGLFSAGGGLLVRLARGERSMAQGFSLLPGELRPPVPATNAGQFGFALDTETSPATLGAAQAHRFADMVSGWGIPGHDGVAWYAHNDPNAAAPARNDLLGALVPFLRRVAGG